MSPVKWLKHLIFLENLIGIYRNFCTQKKIKKYFIITHVVVLIIFKTFIAFCEVYLFLFKSDIHDQMNHIYCYLVLSSFSICLMLIITGISSSQAFVSYIESVSHLLEHFKDDKKYTSFSKLYWFSIFFVLFSITFAILRSSDLVVNFDQIEHDLYMTYCIPVFLSQTYVRICILFQGLILFVVIMIVVNLCKCLYSVILVVQETVGRRDVSSERCDITGDQIQGWVEIYRDLLNCCSKVTMCFGSQFLYLVLISISYYILMSYQMFYLSFLNTTDKKIAIAIMSYVLLTIFPLIAGQLVLNQGMKFHKVLARLYNTMAMIESKKAEAKLIKDFIRLIKKNPLEIKLVSKIIAGAYLLPVMLMSTVNYIIVMLQFNNIV